MKNIETYTINNLFSDKSVQFVIPEYQRRYVWGDDELSDLWNLFIESYEASSYFGSIIISHDGHEKECDKYTIIDGQQRLISVIVTLIACSELGIDSNNANELIFTNCKKSPLKILLHNSDAIQNLLDNTCDNGDKIAQAHGYFKEKILSLDKESQDKFYNVITSNIKFTVLVTSHEQHEHSVTRLFEVINKRGKTLSIDEIEAAKNPQVPTFDLEESEYIEFKEGAILNPYTNKKDKNMLIKVLIAVASFMNSREGGTVYIGIEDKKRIVKGVNREYETANKEKNNWDGYELFICDSIENNLKSPIIFDYYRVKKECINNIDVCKIEIKPASKPVFISNEFHVKTNGRKKKLKETEMAEYIMERWMTNA